MNEPINLNGGELDVPRERGKIIPVGIYKCQAAEVGRAISKIKGTPSIHIQWIVVAPSDFTGVPLFDDLWLTKLEDEVGEDGKPVVSFNRNRIRGVLKALGKPLEGAMQVEEVVTAIKNGGFCLLVVDIEWEKDGFPDKNRVRWYYGLGEKEVGINEHQPQRPIDTGMPPAATGKIVVPPEGEPLDPDLVDMETGEEI